MTEEGPQFVSVSCVGLIDSTDAVFGFWGGGGGGAQETGGGRGGGLQLKGDYHMVEDFLGVRQVQSSLSVPWTIVCR